MKPFPFISILTASLNNDTTVRNTLQSVRDQSFQDLEHIVIDGGSSDTTLDILKEYNNTYNLTWISEPDNGIADALNKGLKKASGRYILVIHADDQLLSHATLEEVYGLLKEEKYDIYCFPVYKKHPEYGHQLLKPIQILWWHRFKTIFLHQGSFVHRRIYDQIGGYRAEFSIALDYDFFYRSLLSRVSVYFGNKPLTLMEGQGFSSNPDFLTRRLKEEKQVQDLNESNSFWRLSQLLFWLFYFPYKTRFLPSLQSCLQAYRKHR